MSGQFGSFDANLTAIGFRSRRTHLSRIDDLHFFNKNPSMSARSILSNRFTWMAVTLAASARLSMGGNPEAPFARAPYLQCATPESIFVVWRTEGPVVPMVRFGENLNSLSSQISSGDVVIRASLGDTNREIPAKWLALRTEENLQLPKLHSAAAGTFQYEAKLAGLKPATRYYYAVFNGEQRLTPANEGYSFTTPPPVGTRQPIRFWVIGDGGTGRQAQADVHRAMVNLLQQEKHPLSFWLHVGDMAYGTGRDVEFQSRFFESYEPTLRSSVCWPAMGNHEGHTSKGVTGIGPYYDAYVLPKRGEAGGLASGTEAYYSFDHGNIHFICLDSHDLDRKPAGAMAKWLKADLERASADWMIAFWHHPPYTKGSHDSDKEKDLTEMREYVMPIIESGGVDLVLTGHSHIYERSMLMDGAYATPTVAENVILDDGDGDPKGDGPYRKSAGIEPHEGTLQIVAGNAGATLGRNGTLPTMRKTIFEHGSVIVDVNGDTLTARMIDREGRVRDLASMVKRGKVDPVRLALPWQSEESTKTFKEKKSGGDMPVDYKTLISRHAEWRYLSGEYPQDQAWPRRDFDDASWKRGVAGFGRGTDEIRTELPKEQGKPSVVFLRKEFAIDQTDKVTELGLVVNYLDAFIAYVNGREVARVGVGRSSGRNAQKLKARDGHGPAFVSLGTGSEQLRNGVNLLAIEVHGVRSDDPDFVIDPYLILED